MVMRDEIALEHHPLKMPTEWPNFVSHGALESPHADGIHPRSLHDRCTIASPEDHVEMSNQDPFLGERLFSGIETVGGDALVLLPHDQLQSITADLVKTDQHLSSITSL